MFVALVRVLIKDVGVMLVRIFAAFKNYTDKLAKLRVRVTRIVHVSRRLKA